MITMVIEATKGGYRCMDCGVISVSKEPVCLKCGSKNVKVL